MAFNSPVFPESREVKVTPLVNDFLFDGSRHFEMADIGDYFVIVNFLENKYFHILEKETGAYVKSFGSYGRGPGELSSYPKIGLNEDKSVFYVFQYAGAMNYFWSYKADDILFDKNVLPVWEDQIKLFLDEGEKYPGAASDFVAWQDRRVFVRNRLHRFEVQDTLGNTLYLYDKYPVVPLNQASDSVYFHDSYIHAAFALKPDMSRLVMASNYGCILEIFTVDVSGTIEKEIEKRFHPPLIEDNKNGRPKYYTDGQVLGISTLSVTDDHIYAKYNGKRYYAEGPVLYPHTIAVFDWSGNPIRRYVLDWSIENFIIDNQYSRCYLVGIDPNDETLLGYFDL